MRLVPKQLWKEEYEYYSNEPVDKLRAEIQNLFDKTRGWNFSVNITGEFISQYEFEATPKWQLAIIKNYERSLAYVKGEIFQDELKRTRVTLTVRPNSIFAIFFYAFPFFGIMLLAGNSRYGTNDSFIVGIVFTFLVPILMMGFGYFAKQGIRKRFVRVFKLTPIG